MISEETLRLFCANDESRKALCNPFNIGEYTYATNAHYAIRINKDPKYDQNEPITSLEEFIDIAMMHVSEGILKSIDDIDLTQEKFTCKNCEGTGKISECPECEGAGDLDISSDYGSLYHVDCKTCGGSGKVKGISSRCGCCDGTGIRIEDRPIDIGTKSINAKLLMVIKDLPNVRIATEAVPVHKPIPFTFDGGCGIVMEMRKMRG